MRKQLLNLTIALFALTFGFASCTSTAPDAPSDDKTGGLTVKFSLAGAGAQTKAIAASTSKPHTTWGDITRAMILFVDPANVVRDARAVTLPTTGDANATNTYLNVVAGTNYDVYIVGNYPTTWNVATIKGANLNTLEITAPAEAGYATSPHFDVATFGYGETGDIFVAKKSGVNVVADATTPVADPFMLTRINSLFRIRLDIETKKQETKNDLIGFTAPTAMFSVRRAATAYQLTGATAYTTAAGAASGVGTYLWGNGATATTKHLNVFFKQAALASANPTAATHTNPTTIVAAGSDYNVTLWNEYRIFPGTQVLAQGTDKFDIVLSALTTNANYIPAGHTAPVPLGTRIFWSGQVQQPVGPNQILELNIAVNGAGGTTLPPVGEYGGLTITVGIVPWGDIVSGNLEF